MKKKLTDDMIVTTKQTGRRSFIKAGIGLFTLAGLALGSKKSRAEEPEDDNDETENDADQAAGDVDETEDDEDQSVDKAENDSDQG